jgi:hypothetical protein
MHYICHYIPKEQCSCFVQLSVNLGTALVVTPLWPTKDGTGFTGEIPQGVTITGRVGILVRKEKSDDAE